MTSRVGVCGSCRARFQIPASFTPNRAKCRTCGGVVEITPPLPPPAPRRAVAPPPAQHAAQHAARPVAASVPATAPAPPPAPVAAPRPVEPAPRSAPAPRPPTPKTRGILLPALLAVGAIVLVAVGFLIFRGSKGTARAPEPAPAPADGEQPR